MLVKHHGARDWTRIAKSFPGRIGKQCRDRWHHQLNPEVSKRKWTIEEDLLILKLHLKFNSRWSQMAKYVPGRSDNQIKNRYNSNLKRRYEQGEFEQMLGLLEISDCLAMLKIQTTHSSSDQEKSQSPRAADDDLAQRRSSESPDSSTLGIKN